MIAGPCEASGFYRSKIPKLLSTTDPPSARLILDQRAGSARDGTHSGQPIIAARRPEPATLKDQPIVTAHDRHGALGAQCPESVHARGFQGSFRLVGSAAQGELIASNFAIMAINHRGQMRPAIGATGNMRYIHRPSLIAGSGLAAPAPHSRPRGARALMHQPPFQFQDPIDHLAIHQEALSMSEQGPKPPIAKRRMLSEEEFLEPRRQQGQQPSRERLTACLAMQSCAGHRQDPATPAFQDTGQSLPHSSDVPRAKGYVYGPIPFAKTIFAWRQDCGRISVL